ncbi:hypothetical protein Ahy_A07g037064 [Arachis hypogaea]|uniref:Isopenicillin N synthase-like Fe(2+) 2OG dioxygenase domain-containing protein n=1 Tax=Arachis hypogaea TaxID=3818 RepID=A0A445CHQ7_ARAHY|nr:hypothetical protein Ahy_A07g037064 [Arachis hypogaea]
MRMNYYPPCPQPEQVIGLTPHSDGGGVTILLQVSEVEGPQIKKDEHRVMVNSEKERFSIATFYGPKYDAIIGSAPNLITEQTPVKFKTIGIEEYLKGLFARKRGKSYRE